MSWSVSAEADNMLDLRRGLKQDFQDKHVGAVEEQGAEEQPWPGKEHGRGYLGMRSVTEEGVSEQFRRALKAAEAMTDHLGGKVKAELSGDEKSISVKVSNA